jgi:hypothetical protein
MMEGAMTTAWCHGIGELIKEAAATSKRNDWRSRIDLQDIHKRTEEAQFAAAMNFAALNGWQVSRKGFWISRLAGIENPDEDEEYNFDWAWDHRLFDHPVYFLSGRKPIAIVGQPYDTSVKDATADAKRLGLALHTPPRLRRSWWYPGRTRFYCFTRPETSVRFLPEQLA